MSNPAFKLINPLEYKERIVTLLNQLNPNKESAYLNSTLTSMANLPNYRCFALFNNNELIGISSGWTTIRIYSGKHLELDNVIIDSQIQSKGFGKWFISNIKKWAIENEYKCVGLNTYTQNSRSHKFYYNMGFQVLGFHFEDKFA